ncbi:MAG: hypothetical protein WKF35_03660 [Ferruginibacter sp.]
METKSTQQEILLFTNTRFSSRQWTGKEDPLKENNLSSKEKLEEACWNGLIWKILPEICEKTNETTLTLWEINVANSFFDLKFSEFPKDVENEYSIDPYKFLEVQSLN